MSFATPLLAGIAAAIAVPTLLLLYFLKLRRRDIEISSTLLWKKTIEDMQANAPFQRLRKNLLLFLQLLALAFGLLALAQPELAEGSVVGGRHTILIDRSASMSAMDGVIDGRTVSRLDQSKHEALQFIDALAEPGWLERAIGGASAAGDRATVIAFDVTGEIVQSLTDDKTRLRDAIASIEPTDAATRASEAYRLALAQSPAESRTNEDGSVVTLPPSAGMVHLWSDGRLSDASEIAPGPGDSVVYRSVGGGAAANIGITGLRAERAYESPSSVSVFVGLGSSVSAEMRADVELRIDGAIVGVREATLGAASESGLGSGGVVFTIEYDSPAIAEVRIKPIDGTDDLLASDDVGWVVIPPIRRLRVALVSEDGFFTALALDGLPLDRLTRLTPKAFGAAAQGDGLGAFDVVIFDGWWPEEGLGPGSYVVLGGVPPGLGIDEVAGADAVSDEIVDWDASHPVMRDLELGGRVAIAETPRLRVEPSASAVVLAEAGSGPVIIDVATARTRTIVVAFDPGESSWPFDVSYVVFLASAIDALGGTLDTVSSLSAAPGLVYADRLPIGASSVRVLVPGENDLQLTPSPDGRVAFGPLRTTGVYTLEWSGPAGTRDVVQENRVRRPVAVNLIDAEETDVRAADRIGFASADAIAEALGSVSSPVRLWRWLLVALLALLLVEWWVFNRRVYL